MGLATESEAAHTELDGPGKRHRGLKETLKLSVKNGSGGIEGRVPVILSRSNARLFCSMGSYHMIK